MRHARDGRKFNRTSAHRKALYRNMAQSLFEHGEIRTTIPKAKEVRRLADRLVTLAIDGSLASRQRAIAMLNDRAIIAKDNRGDYDGMSDAKRNQVLRSRSGRRYRAATTRPGVKFTAESVIHKLFSEVGPRLKERNEKLSSAGGYTRVIKLAERRLGDAAQLAVLQLTSPDDAPRKKSTDKTERRRRSQIRYAAYAGKSRSRRGPRRAAKNVSAAATADPPAAPAESESKDS